jgi:hypothetical protein
MRWDVELTDHVAELEGEEWIVVSGQQEEGRRGCEDKCFVWSSDSTSVEYRTPSIIGCDKPFAIMNKGFVP